MKKIKIIFKILLIVALLIATIITFMYDSKSTILNSLEKDIKEYSYLSEISDKQKLIFLGEKTENIEIIQNYINETNLSEYVDFIYLEPNTENVLFISEILKNPKPDNVETFVLLGKQGEVIKYFDTSIDSFEMITLLREYFERYI